MIYNYACPGNNTTIWHWSADCNIQTASCLKRNLKLISRGGIISWATYPHEQQNSLSRSLFVSLHPTLFRTHTNQHTEHKTINSIIKQYNRNVEISQSIFRIITKIALHINFTTVYLLLRTLRITVLRTPTI